VTQRKKPSATDIQVGGYELCWTLVRETQWCSENDYQGIAISVRRTGAVRRELILKYPFLGMRPNGSWHLPERPKITTKIVEDAIRGAIEAGWDPDSRGKTFTFQVPKAAN
jgi:hypothetical protein